MLLNSWISRLNSVRGRNTMMLKFSVTLPFFLLSLVFIGKGKKYATKNQKQQQQKKPNHRTLDQLYSYYVSFLYNSLHASSFDVTESRPVSGVRLSPLNHVSTLEMTVQYWHRNMCISSVRKIYGLNRLERNGSLL